VHRVWAGVDAQDESVAVSRGVSQNEAAVAGPQVHRHRGVGRGEIGQLTDVHLGQAASGEQSHAEIILT